MCYTNGLSIDFIKSKTDLDKTDFTNVEEINPEPLLLELCEDYHTLSFNKGKMTSYIEYNPSAPFEFYTMASCCHDGTLLFTYQMIEECLNNVLCAKTYDVRQPAPEEKCKIKYTIGNLVLVQEYDERFGSEEKPWTKMRTSVFLPVIYRRLE